MKSATAHWCLLGLLALAASRSGTSRGEDLSFSGTGTVRILASDWADYVGGSPTLLSANDGGRLYDRGSAGDGNFIHFSLSRLQGLTMSSDATVTLQNTDATYGGSVDNSFIATANSAWQAATGAAVPGATAIAGAINATGSYGSGTSIGWGIPQATFQGYVNAAASFNGVAVIGGSGSQMHFNGPLSPYLSVSTSAAMTNVVTVTGGAAWNSANYAFADGVLTINDAVVGGTSGAGAVTINALGTVFVNGDGGDNRYWAIDSTTINGGGVLLSYGHSHLHNLTLAGGELAGIRPTGSFGGWTFDDPTTVTGGVTSTISALQMNLDNGTITVDAGSTLNVTGSIRSGSITKNGGGTMRLTSSGTGGAPVSTQSGATVINAGTIEIYGRSADNGGYTSLGSGPVTINAGGTLVSANDWSTGNNWNGGAVGLITVNSGGTWTINAAGNTVRNGLALNGGTVNGPGANGDWGGMFLKNTSVTAGGAAISTIAVDTAMESQTTFTVDAGSRLDYTGVIHNAIGTNSGITKAGPGTLVLAGANTYTSPTIFEGGTVNAATLADYGSNSSLGNRSADGAANVGLLFRGGTLQYTGATAQSTNRGIRLSTTGGTIDASGSDPSATLTFSASSSPDFFEEPGSRTLTLTGSNQGNNTFAMAIAEAGGTTAVVKNGVGRWVLTGTSTYTGGTDVNAGTLLVNGSLGATTVSVASAATLGGSGQIGGPVSILPGGILAPGTSPGTLTINDALTLDGGSILAFEIDALSTVVGSGVNDLITGVTNLTLGGTLNLSGSGDFTAVTQGTTWRLIDYSGTLTDNTLSIGTAPSLAAGLSFAVDTSTPNQVNISVVPEPGTLGLAALGLAAAGWLVHRRTRR